MFQVKVTDHRGVELDLKVFETELKARNYARYEWGDTDQIIDIVMVNSKGDRSVFDDVDQ